MIMMMILFIAIVAFSNMVVDVQARPNIVVIQPDDLQSYDDWSRPPNNPNTRPANRFRPLPPVPNIERLRKDGAWMKQAYTTSPACGTSRYSTITGKYPSRAASSRNSGNSQDYADVTIPNTKLEDYGIGQNDCTEENLGVTFRDTGYKTGMIGKWHLSYMSNNDYTYQVAKDTVQGCGFDFVDGLYIENFKSKETDYNTYFDGTFSHNMEWITYEAVNFITANANESFFLYFNPTVPHGAQDVKVALEDYPCRNTSNGDIGFDPMIKNMTLEYGNCEDYRQTIFNRSLGNDDHLGPIWVDDAIGAILQTLEDLEILDNTIFLFQQDHGMETKSGIWEGGTRISQFVHYPNEIPAETEIDAPVSTIDIGATLLDYAGITANYTMDGLSWRNMISDETEEDGWFEDRCLFFEMEHDRAVRCGCHKYMSIESDSSTWVVGDRKGYPVTDGLVTELLFDLCNGSDEYNTDVTTNTEATNLISNPTLDSTLKTLKGAIKCHEDNTNVNLQPEFLTCDDLQNTKNTPAPTIIQATPPTKSPTANPTARPTSNPTNSPTLPQPEECADCQSFLSKYDNADDSKAAKKECKKISSDKVVQKACKKVVKDVLKKGKDEVGSCKAYGWCF